jgi:hypothetical protein
MIVPVWLAHKVIACLSILLDEGNKVIVTLALIRRNSTTDKNDSHEAVAYVAASPWERHGSKRQAPHF